VLLTVMNFVSHGTQDMYPTFLEKQRGLGPRTVATIVAVSNFGALFGGIAFGFLSDRWGRRRAMATAVILGAFIVPLWIYPSSLVWLATGAFAIQFMVQGAWGVVPAHLAEMAPAQARGLFSGVAYQLGVLFASYAALVEALVAERFGYATALAGFAVIVTIAAAIVILLGTERKGQDLRAAGG
jgi:SHS family lactate transporter-like MFS transporter